MSNLDDLLTPGEPLPSDDVMIAKALEIMEHSPHGQHLVKIVKQENINIGIMSTPKPMTYLPETKKAYVGFNRHHPISPSAFIMLLTGVLREAEQELGDLKYAEVHEPDEKHIKVGIAKIEDKFWYMCTVAVELDDQEHFSKYGFLDELRKMGHTEIVELYLKQEQPD